MYLNRYSGKFENGDEGLKYAEVALWIDNPLTIKCDSPLKKNADAFNKIAHSNMLAKTGLNWTLHNDNETVHHCKMNVYELETDTFTLFAYINQLGLIADFMYQHHDDVEDEGFFVYSETEDKIYWFLDGCTTTSMKEYDLNEYNFEDPAPILLPILRKLYGKE